MKTKEPGGIRGCDDAEKQVPATRRQANVRGVSTEGPLGRNRVFEALAKREAKEYQAIANELLASMDRVLGKTRIYPEIFDKMELMDSLEAIIQDCVESEERPLLQALVDLERKCPEIGFVPCDEEGKAKLKEGIAAMKGARETLKNVEARVSFTVQCEEYEAVARSIYTSGAWLVEKGGGGIEAFFPKFGGNATLLEILERFGETALIKCKGGRTHAPKWSEYETRMEEVLEAKRVADLVFALVDEARKSWERIMACRKWDDDAGREWPKRPLN